MHLIFIVFFGGENVNYSTEFYSAISPYYIGQKLILTRRFSRFLNITVRGAKIILVYKSAKMEPLRILWFIKEDASNITNLGCPD